MATTLPGPSPSVFGGEGGTGTLQGLSSFGNIMAIAGVATSAIGAYYSVLGQRYQLRSQALDLEFQGSIADINARAAEREAHTLIEAGKHEKALSTLRYGQAKEATRVQAAASGLQAGVGSSAEVQASIEVAKQLDSLTIERNALRAVGRTRSQAVNFRNQALLSRVSAHNLRRFAGNLIPGLSALTSLVGGAGQVASSYLYQQQFAQNQS